MKFLIMLALMGCSSVSPIESQFIKSPSPNLKFSSYHIEVFDDANNSLRGFPAESIIQDQFEKRLGQIGFQKAKGPEKAELFLMVILGSKNRSVFIPAHTIGGLVYRPPQNYNIYGTNSFGNSYSGTVSSQAAYENQQQYVGARTVDVQDQFLRVFAMYVPEESWRETLFQGQVWRKDTNVEFLGNEKLLREAVDTISTKNSISSYFHKDEEISKARGCTKRLGVFLGAKEPGSSIDIIKFVHKNSAAFRLGIKPMDKLVHIGPYDLEQFFRLNPDEKNIAFSDELVISWESRGKMKKGKTSFPVVCHALGM